MRPQHIYQGADVSLVVEVSGDSGLSSATEIEWILDTPDQIEKSLSGGQITAVSDTGFTVQVLAADTADTTPSMYKQQARATIGGKKYQIRFIPNRLEVRHSVFENESTSGNDYR